MKEKIIKEINNNIDESIINFNKIILQIKPNGYGEKDTLLGVRSPVLRKIAKKYYKDISNKDIKYFLTSNIHEYRLLAVMIMILKMPHNSQNIFDLYIENIDYINNWDIIDISCSHIIGSYLYENYNLKKINNFLNKLYNSKNFWHRRISIVTTMYFIKRNMLDFCLKFYKQTINDNHDLNNKALGWCLREIYKKDKNKTINFIKENKIKNITFNYALEKMPKEERNKYRKYLHN